MRLLALPTLVLATACTPGSPDTGDSAVLLEEPLSAENLEAFTRALTELGPRMSGTPAEVEAAELVARLFTEAGLQDVAAEPFTWDAWQPGPASLTVGDTVFEVSALSPTPPTTGLVAPLVAATDPEGFEGAIALFSSDRGARAEQFIEARAGGAAAMVRITEDTDTDGALLVEVGHTFATSTLPAVATDRDTGAAMMAMVGESARLDAATSTLPGHQSVNIVGVVPGRSSRTVYITAHYDSWHPSESAIDNALGVAMMVSLAHHLRQGPTPRYTVVFLATAGEEQGLQGAIAWTAEHADTIGAEGRAVLNLDIPWAAEGTFWCSSTDPAITELALDLAQAEGLQPRDGGTPSASSDHVPFQGRGLEATWLTRQPDRHYHTSRDTIDWLDFDEVAASARVHAGLLE